MSQTSTRLQQAGNPGSRLRALELEMREQRPLLPAGWPLTGRLAATAFIPDLLLVCEAKLQVMTVTRLGTAQEPGTEERS